ncbi:unnamed protein product [Protopolystoma xenopodis]|uniref:Uncharacterized protein n=1 Tax=Protopolystoma xenopodis TaxID=117903 RepID=A0A3S5BT67_9PLAT|nr:unnamed protein product [Protopolystoma xenopodis]
MSSRTDKTVEKQTSNQAGPATHGIARQLSQEWGFGLPQTSLLRPCLFLDWGRWDSTHPLTISRSHDLQALALATQHPSVAMIACERGSACQTDELEVISWLGAGPLLGRSGG